MFCSHDVYVTCARLRLIYPEPAVHVGIESAVASSQPEQIDQHGVDARSVYANSARFGGAKLSGIVSFTPDPQTPHTDGGLGMLA